MLFAVLHDLANLMFLSTDCKESVVEQSEPGVKEPPLHMSIAQTPSAAKQVVGYHSKSEPALLTDGRPLERAQGDRRMRRRARDILSYQGVGSLFWRLLQRLADRWGYLGTAFLWERDLASPLPEVRSKVDVVILEATLQDLAQLTRLVQWRRYGAESQIEPLSSAITGEVLDRFERGWKCFVAKKDGQILHYNWIAFQWAKTVPSGGRFIDLRDDEVYTADSYTVQAWRGKGLHGAVLYLILYYLRESGFRTAYTLTGMENRSSWIGHQRLGYSRRGSALIFVPKGSSECRVQRLRGRLSHFFETEATMRRRVTPQHASPGKPLQ
jgi:GNAT superfamily N-acetyltransferase